MSIFTPRRPRGFHHTYIYYDERAEKLRKIEERAKLQLGMTELSAPSHSPIRGTFANATRHLRRRKERESTGGSHLSPIVIMLLIVVLAAIWIVLA